MYRIVGRSGLKVSNISLGTMTFGEHERPGNCSEALSHQIMSRYLEMGGNFIDTADVYCNGRSEEIVGTWLSSGSIKRDELVLATKARMADGKEGPINGACLSRKHLISELDLSLSRMKTDYIDLYQWHCWDKTTPLEESLRTMDDLIKAGKIRYFGVSNFCGWQLQKLMDMCKYMGLSPCISLQQQYNLLERNIELDLVDVCENENVAILPWSPLKGGWLSGKFTRSMTEAPEGTRVRFATDKKSPLFSHPTWDKFANNDQVWNLLDKMTEIGAAHQRSPSQVAIRWLLQKKRVTSVIIGVKTMEQLEDNMGAMSGWELTPEDMTALDYASQYETPYPYAMINRVNRSK